MSTNNPFKGPQSYNEGDSLYGRDKEISELYELMREELLTLLFSRSGTGKTSLLKAGLIPFLRRDFEFLPVYIHLNDLAIKSSLANDLTHYVIESCKKQVHLHIEGKKEFKISIPENYVPDSLFEFMYKLQIVQEVKIERVLETNLSAGEEVVDTLMQTAFFVKPVLIFDQFEEIFTTSFEKKELHHLLEEIHCLLTDEIPPYLDSTFNDSSDPGYLKLMNALMSKQKNFRIIFSFREEYLPQFESLGDKIPSIRYTDSRYRLEPFSKETASEVITKTEPAISETTACLVTENLAVNILHNFDKIIIEPFLMSLVCQKIYPDLLSQSRSSDEGTADRIKQLVSNAIENHINDVYNSINVKTREFIENKLITSDNKRTPFSYEAAIRDHQIGADITKLIKDPDYRLLNQEIFLDSLHVELLHDRLLPPIAARRDERKKKTEEEDLKLRRLQLEKEYEAKSRAEQEVLAIQNKNRKKWHRLYWGIAAVLFLLLIGYNYIQTKTKQTIRANSKIIEENRDSIEKLYESLKYTNKDLEAKQDSLVKARDFNESLNNELRNSNDRLTHSNDLLKGSNNELEKARLAVIKQRDSIRSANSHLQDQNKTISQEREDKIALAARFQKQTNVLIRNLQYSSPFTTLAIAHSNYHEIANMGIHDSNTIRDFGNTFLKVYNESRYFTRTQLPYSNKAVFSQNNALAAVSNQTRKSLVFYIYKLSEPDKMPVLFISNNTFFSGTDTMSGKASSFNEKNVTQTNEYSLPLRTTYGFSDEGDFFYAIIASSKKSQLVIWRTSPPVSNARPNTWNITGLEIDLLTRIKARNNKLIFLRPFSKGYVLRSFDANSGKESSAFLKLKKKKNEEVLDFDSDNLITRRLEEYSIYGEKPNRSYSIKTPQGSLFNYISYYSEDSIALGVSENQSSVIKFLNSAAKQVDVTIPFTLPDIEYLFVEPNRIVAYSPVSRKLTIKDKTGPLWNDFMDISLGLPDTPQKICFSSDNQLFATSYGKRSIAIYDLVVHQLIDTFSLAEDIRSAPVFTADKKTLIIPGSNYLYTFYFSKPNNITTIQKLEQLLKSDYFHGAWPIPKAERIRYGITEVDD